MSRYLLDTSAVIAHFFQETGGDAVERLFNDPSNVVTVCAVTFLELHSVLKAKAIPPAEIAETIALYDEIVAEVFPADLEAVRHAIDIRGSLRERLPLADALIAGCAACHGATLVHRDSHLATIPEHLVKQVLLSSQTSENA